MCLIYDSIVTVLSVIKIWICDVSFGVLLLPLNGTYTV